MIPTRLGAAVLFCALLGISPASAVPVTQAAVRGPSLDSIDLRELAAVADPPVLSQQAYMKASGTDAGDHFGHSIAISGDTIVVGAPEEDSNATGVDGNETNDLALESGAAYVFTRSAGTWSQQAYLKASNTGAGDQFGFSVAISGDTIVVGAPFEDSNAIDANGDEANNDAEDSGAVYAFTRSAGIWSQQDYLKPLNTDAGDLFGHSVAVSGDKMVVGARREDSKDAVVDGDEANNEAEDAGAAYVFSRGAGWRQQTYLKASNTGALDSFGSAVAISGDAIVVAAEFEDSNATGVDGNGANNDATNSGAAYVFESGAGTWSQRGYLKASNTETLDAFGSSVAVSGDTIVVAAQDEDSNATGVDGDDANNDASRSGSAYVFTRGATTWSQEAYLKASNAETFDRFGWSVAVSGDTIVVGALFEESSATGVNGDQANNDVSPSGAAYVFTRSVTTWSQQAFLKASNTGLNDSFGASVAISDDTIVVGGDTEDSSATGVDGDQSSNSATNSGAAYVFGPPCATAPFSDVSTGHAFCAEIEWMKHSAISTGFNDGSYGPSLGVTRQAMSAFMARFADATLTECAEPPFTDVPIDHAFCEEIQWMKDEAISTGFGDGTYGPALNVTRQAMSAFMSRLADATLTACAVPPFTDVPISHPFCEEIKWMKDSGISTGFGDGTYGPSLVVTRQAMSAFIYRLNNLLYNS